MAKKLTVILGAGASYGLNPVNPVSHGGKPLDNENYRPPLAKDIFHGSREFRAILNKYPLAETLASDIDRRIRQNKDGIGLEQILKNYQTLLTQGNDTLVTRQFLQIPLYLNELFGEISTHFTKQPDEYNTLVNLCLTNVDEVLFLTLNYDTLLEIPLSRNFGTDFNGENNYIENKEWALVKLHGSVNWYKQFTSYQFQEANDREYFGILKRSALPLPLAKDFTFVSMRDHAYKYVGNAPVYPAITVPVDGKYDLNCPESHLEKAKEFLSDCHNYLIVGTSGRDKDLLDLLKSHASGGRILLIGGSDQGVKSARENFMLHIPQFQSNFDTFYHASGFSVFVDSGKLDEFLERLV